MTQYLDLNADGKFDAADLVLILDHDGVRTSIGHLVGMAVLQSKSDTDDKVLEFTSDVLSVAIARVKAGDPAQTSDGRT